MKIILTVILFFIFGCFVPRGGIHQYTGVHMLPHKFDILVGVFYDKNGIHEVRQCSIPDCFKLDTFPPVRLIR